VQNKALIAVKLLQNVHQILNHSYVKYFKPLNYNLCEKSFRTSQTTPVVFITKTNRLMQFEEIIGISREIGRSRWPCCLRRRSEAA